MPHILGKLASRVLRTYYLGPHHPMKLRLYWGVRKLLGYPRLTIPYAERGWITVDERDVVAGHVFVTGTYEPEVWNALAACAAADEVVWDVGAHIGTLAIKAMLDPRVHEVHAFEPDPTNADILTFNLELNQGCYKVHRLALHRRAERRNLHRAPISNTGLSSFVSGFTDETCAVDCQTADYLVFNDGVTPPTLMKVDVEGWELHVLQGAGRLLGRRPPKAIVFEAECNSTGKMANSSLTLLLRESGYTTHRIARLSGELQQRENYLAVHESLKRAQVSSTSSPAAL